MDNIYFSQDPNVTMAYGFYEYVKQAEKSYDQDQIIDWIERHRSQLEGEKVWLLTGHAYEKSYEDWEQWLLDNGYTVLVDCRGFGQVLLGELKFRYASLKKQLESKGVTVYRLSDD
ncbi:hypothetical protein [Streptococcus merionis]|uniref:Uncharacterized protein n=1 Tax=Streptococcus merionis TaxID=400065 RepID=A0A239SQA6_9STRE|nr:hypothetical protein [Streptococcus merionis]SNU86924.1 Uncharacterised protein [Streptococcus merionis]